MDMSYAKALLGYNVPQYIQHIKDRGGVSQEELNWLQCQQMKRGLSKNIYGIVP